MRGRAGWTGFDPLCANLYVADESDAWAWSNDTEIVVYSGVSSAGYPWGVDIPDEAADNVDVVVTVDTSRHAELFGLELTSDIRTRRFHAPYCQI